MGIYLAESNRESGDMIAELLLFLLLAPAFIVGGIMLVVALGVAIGMVE